MSVGPIHLGVNVDHVATVRQARGSRYPDPVAAALLAEQAGADSITIHLREDRRHIQDRDLEVLGRVLQTRINLEMAVTEPMLEIAARAAPADCCFVPERRAELTTEGGLDVAGQANKIAAACARAARARNPRVAVRRSGLRSARRERGRGRAGRRAAYRGVRGSRGRRGRARARAAPVRGRARRVARSHGARGSRAQLPQRRADRCDPEIVELNIGHAIVAQALFDGFAGAVAKMKALMVAARA